MTSTTDWFSLEVIRQHRRQIEEDLRSVILASIPRKEKELEAFRRQQVDKLYDKLASRPILPCRNSFRQLPSVKLIDFLDQKSIREYVDNGKIMPALNDNLASWLHVTKDAFGKKLGYEKWISVSTKQFHPADRADAFFQCLKCQHVPERNALHGTLSFGEACRHICSGLSKVKRNRVVWTPDTFEVDQKVGG